MRKLHEMNSTVFHTVRDRECGRLAPQGSSRQLQFTANFARKLCREATLHGHTGCVNRLAWSEDGCYLVSGSDDRSLRVWQYPSAAHRPLVIDTYHQGNIFGAAFLPATDNRELVSGAMDNTVQHHVMDAAPRMNMPVRKQQGEQGNRSQQSVTCHTTLYTPHKGRIKDVEVAPADPSLFWSASEDGSVRQFDKRCSTASQRDYESPNVLIEVENHGRPLELKSVAINKCRPWQMAVAAGDSCVRLYDRRKLTLSAPSVGAPAARHTMLELTPPHLAFASSSSRLNEPHVTYVRFGSRGQRVIATYHGDHAYAFDVTAAQQQQAVSFQALGSSHLEDASVARGADRTQHQGWLSAAAELERGEGFQALMSQQYSSAITHYSRALRLAPTSALLLAKRATALQLRGWIGDSMFALRDCNLALKYEPGNAETMLLKAEALTDLGLLEEARAVAEAAHAADQAMSEDVAQVLQRIEDLMMERERQAEERAAQMARQQAYVQPSASHGDDSDGYEPHAEEQEQGGTWVRPADRASSPAARFRHFGTSSQAQSEAADTASDVAGHRNTDPTSGKAAVLSNGVMAEAQSPVAPWSSEHSRRLLQRYVGHCNCVTDIKEAAFLGHADQLVACGSDDGRIFIYDAETGEVVQVLQADEEVANCVAAHPHLPLLATSGIESVVRLWSPGQRRSEEDIAKMVADNQQRMRQGPQLLRGINPRILQAIRENPELLEALVHRAGFEGIRVDVGEQAIQDVDCRVS